MENVILLEDIRYTGNISAHWYWNNTIRYKNQPQNNTNNGINNYIAMTFIHFAFKQWDTVANTKDVYQYVCPCPFLLLLSGWDVTLKSRRVAS